MAYEQFTNDPASTLASTMDGLVTTLSVAVATGFPLVPNFRIRVDNELMLVTGVSGTTFTVTRAIENTIAAPHSIGAPLNCYLTAGSLAQGMSDRILTGSFTALPSAGVSGRLYLPTDSIYNYCYDTGSAWQYFYDGKLMIPPSATSGWTNVNLGTSGITIDDTYGYRSIFYPTTINTNQYGYQWVPISGSGWTRTMWFRMFGGVGTNINLASVVMSDGTKSMFLSTYQVNGGSPTLSLYTSTDVNGAGGGINPYGADLSVFLNLSTLTGLRIVDDGTNLNFLFSADGHQWVTWKTAARTAFFSTGATRIGFAMYQSSNTSATPRVLDVLHWQ